MHSGEIPQSVNPGSSLRSRTSAWMVNDSVYLSKILGYNDAYAYEFNELRFAKYLKDFISQ